ncbi:hypothetical protein [Clostridium sp.]|uniref:hypothetical protein n=1 Tax=Clostridium sp. TaxID=1506 RepID=UPI003991265F
MLHLKLKDGTRLRVKADTYDEFVENCKEGNVFRIRERYLTENLKEIIIPEDSIAIIRVRTVY